MAINSLDEITCDTSLSLVLKSEDIYEELKCIDGSSTTMKNINDRQMAINVAGTSGGLSTAIMVDGQYNCLEYGETIIDQYDACGRGFETICQQVGLLSETQEFNELSTLRTKVKEKIQSIQDKIGELDKEADDYDSKVADCRHEMTRYDIKLGQIESRIGKLNPSINGASAEAGASGGTASGTAATSGNKLFNTGDDDNNKVYGADGSVIDGETLGKINNSRVFWQMGEGRIGLNGELVSEDDPNASLYNKYFKCKITCKDGVEREVYVVCPSSGYGTSDDSSLKSYSNPILYISEDANGHKVCYDNSGNPVSYNTAMNIMEISRCSNPAAQGSIDVYNNRTFENTNPSPYSPTLTYTQEGYDENTKTSYVWSKSETDANGKAWSSYSTKTFDESGDFQPLDLSQLHGKYEVYSKDNGDMGRVNVLLDEDDSVRYYSIKQPDGTFLYYDENCKPTTPDVIISDLY